MGEQMAPGVAPPDRRAWGAMLMLATGVGAWLLVTSSGHWFFADDWTFVNRAGADDLNLWVVPYSGHWMAATVAWFTAMKELVNLDSYVPYMLPAIVGHVTSAVLLWRWQVRDGVSPWLAMAVVAPFLVLGASSENVFFAVNLGFNLSLALALGFGLLVDVDPETRSTRRLVGGSLLALASIVTTTTGPLIVAAVAVALAIRRDWRGVVVGAFPALVGYGAWLVLADGGSGLAGGPTGVVATYVGRLFASGTTRALGVAAPWLGGVVIGVLVVGALVRRGGPLPRWSTLGLAATGGTFAVATALARVKFGESTWQSPRYLYVVAALTLPLVGVLIARIVRDSRVLAGVAVVVLAVAAVGNVGTLREADRNESGLEAHLRTRHLAAAQLLEEGLVPVPINVDRYWSPNLHWTHLLTYAADGTIPVPNEPVPDPWRLEAEIELRSVLHGPNPFGVLTTPTLTGVGADGCVDLGPGEEAQLGLDGPAGLEFRFDAPTLVRMQTTTADGRTTAFPRILDLRVPSPRSWWISLADEVTMTMTIDAGATVCILDQQSAKAYDNTEPG